MWPATNHIGTPCTFPRILTQWLQNLQFLNCVTLLANGGVCKAAATLVTVVAVKIDVFDRYFQPYMMGISAKKRTRHVNYVLYRKYVGHLAAFQFHLTAPAAHLRINRVRCSFAESVAKIRFSLGIFLRSAT